MQGLFVNIKQHSHFPFVHTHILIVFCRPNLLHDVSVLRLHSNKADAWKIQIHCDHLMQPGSIYKPFSLLQPGSCKVKLKTFMNIGGLWCLFMRKLQVVLHIYHHLALSALTFRPLLANLLDPVVPVRSHRGSQALPHASAQTGNESEIASTVI